MTTPNTHPPTFTQRHLWALVLLTGGLAAGCQTPGFTSALTGKKTDAQAVASAESGNSTEAGLPEPTNTATSNSPLSLSSVDEHLRLGDEQLARGNHQQAQSHFERILEKHPEHAKANHRLGVLADKQNRYEAAEQHYLTALADDPRNASLLSDLGYSYYMQGRHADAERYLLESRKVDPQYETAIANLGLLYGSTGRRQEALALFRQIGDENQVTSIMQQIDDGQFGSTGQIAANAQQSQQTSVVTTQSSAQQSANGIGARQDPTQDFATQLRKAREELRRAEEEFARHQQTQNSQLAQTVVPNQQMPQQPAWIQQAAPQQGQQPAWQTQPSPAQQPQPGNEATRYDAVASVQPSSNPGMTNNPAGMAQQNTAAPLPEVTPRPRGGSWQPEVVPAQPSSALATQAPNAGHQTHAAAGPGSQSPTAPTGQSAWGQAAPEGQDPSHNAIIQAGNAQANQPPAAWGQQPATSIDRSGAQAATGPSQGIQQMSGTVQAGGPQQPVEHALHTQDPQHSSDVMLASGQGGAGAPSAGPLPQIGSQPSASQLPEVVGNGAATAPQANSYDAARRKAALLGLNAGPGQVFPYVQRYERVRGGSAAPMGSGPHSTGQSATPPGVTSSGNPAPGATQQFRQAPHQQGFAHQNSSEPAPQQWQQQSWQQQAANGHPSGTSAQASVPSNHHHQQHSWGQQPPASGATPSTTTQNYRPPTSAVQQRSHVTPVPYYERPGASTQGQGGAVQTGYQSPPPATSYAPQQTSGGVVVPEAYPNRQPAPAGSYHYPQQRQQQMPVQQSPHQQQPSQNAQPYTGPTIVPAER